MSWDISIMKFSRPYDDVSKIHESPQPLGPRQDVHRAVLDLFPGTDWSDPAWGIWRCEIGSIQFNLGDNELADGMMLHVRAGSEVVPGIVALCLSNGWQGFDCSSGEFIERTDHPEEGHIAWTAYRNRVIGDQINRGERQGMAERQGMNESLRPVAPLMILAGLLVACSLIPLALCRFGLPALGMLVSLLAMWLWTRAVRPVPGFFQGTVSLWGLGVLIGVFVFCLARVVISVAQ